jgi:glycosyltransferase involved in cell wall biosynthesis
MGRLEPERRLDVLIDAMPDILREVPGAKLSIAGAGKEEARLRARVEALGVSNAVSWLGWVAEPADVLAASHVLVNTLADEGFGMAMAEAMGFGLPVIAPARGASTEIVEDGVTGALVPPGDPVSLASAVTQMLRERGRAAEMGTRARDRAIDRFGVEHTVQATLAFYLRTLGQLHGDGTGEGAALLPQRSSR